MRKVAVTIIIFILTLLVACKPGEPLLRMDTPRGLIVDKNVLTFNEVPNATSYIINANGINIEIFDTKYTFEEPGLYRVKIKALGEEKLDSLFSEEVIVDVKYLLRMDTPRGLTVDKNVLTFNEVPNATSYIINANGINIETIETEYTFEEPGLYRVKIKAVGEEKLDSLFSEEVIVDVKYLEHPDEIDIINHLITFNNVEGADYYNIEINGELYNTSIDIIKYLEPGNYKIRIQSISKKYINSEFSPLTEYEVKKDDPVVTINNYSYSYNANFDLLLFCYKCIDLSVTSYELDIITLDEKEEVVNKERVDKDNLYIFENAVYVKGEFVHKLMKIANERKEDYAHLLLKTDLGEHEILIKFNNNKAPYIYSDKQVKTNFYHVVEFRFDTFEADFIDITGHEITEDDYVYNEGILKINPEFMIKAFEKLEGVNELIFTYRFERERDTFLGFIKVSR